MALILNDRVKETSVSTGTADFALGGAETGFQAFSAGVGANNTTYYAAADATDWEVGLGTLSSDGLTLARTTVYTSSNSDAKVVFSAGTKNVFVSYPSSVAASALQPSDNISSLTNNSGYLTSATSVYATPDDLPLSGNAAGDLAFVTSTNRMYLFTGAGWFNIALINTNPTITNPPNAEYLFEIDGTPIILTLTATDPEGVPIVWSYAVTAGSLGSTATIGQVDNVFTLTPSATPGDEGVFSVTFTASDGVNLATAVSQFTLSFVLASYTSTKTPATTEIVVPASYPTDTWFEVADEYAVTLLDNLVVDIDIWGGGGGGGSSWVSSVTNGGAGGYSYARGVQLAAGTYKFVVGAGGRGGIYLAGESQATMDSLNEDFGDGGLGTQGNYQGSGQNGNDNGGCAGGFSGIFSTSVAFANALFISGGGGGAGTGAGNHGGQGGGTTGANGVSGGLHYGRGGTQSAGGIGASSGGAGAQLQGGDGIISVNSTGFGGGGGGGGYYGGGAVGSSGGSGMGGGGGGSGYITTALTMTSSGSETATAKKIPTTTATGAPSNTSAGYGGATATTHPAVDGYDGAIKFTVTGTF